METTKKYRILYMEDDAGAARLLQKRLSRQGFEVVIARDGEQGLEMAADGDFDVLTIDQNMPVYDGLDVIRKLSERGPLPPIIMITGTGDEGVAVEAMKLGARDYIVKDIEGGYLSLLPTVIEHALQQCQLEKDKRQAEADREHLIEELNAFAHTVAHDLKNPLTTILNYSTFLNKRHTKLPPEEVDHSLEILEQTGYRMRNIIDELLLLSQVRDLKEIEIEPLDMGRIVLDSQERLSHMIREHRADIIFPDKDIPKACGYAPWIEAVWVNFISNALKYGGQPPRVEWGGHICEEGDVRYWITDNGDGIPSDKVDTLFTPFTRLSQARAQGHGLGLSIVQRIIEKLGGSVGVESQEGVGSTFWFTLPTKS